MSVKLLIEQHLEIVSLTGGCTGSPESTLVKMPHCWKSHVAAHMCNVEMVLLIMYCHITSKNRRLKQEGLKQLCALV